MQKITHTCYDGAIGAVNNPGTMQCQIHINKFEGWSEIPDHQYKDDSITQISIVMHGIGITMLFEGIEIITETEELEAENLAPMTLDRFLQFEESPVIIINQGIPWVVVPSSK